MVEKILFAIEVDFKNVLIKSIYKYFPGNVSTPSTADIVIIVPEVRMLDQSSYSLIFLKRYNIGKVA